MKLSKKIMLTLAAIATTALIAGCSDTKEPATPKKPAPPPIAAIKLESGEANIFEIKGLALNKENCKINNMTANSRKLFISALMKKSDVISKTRVNKIAVIEADINNDEVRNLKAIGVMEQPQYDRTLHATSKGAIWAAKPISPGSAKVYYSYYNGVNTKDNLQLNRSAHHFAFNKKTDQLYEIGSMPKTSGLNLIARKFDGNKFTEDTLIIEGSKLKSINGNLNATPHAADTQNVYMRFNKGKQMLQAYNNKRLIYTVTGTNNVGNDWAITRDKIVFADRLGNILVFNKSNGKFLGETKIDNMGITILASDGNRDVYAYDEKGDRLLRIKF